MKLVGTTLGLFREEGKLADFIHIFMSFGQRTIGKFLTTLPFINYIFIPYISRFGLFFKKYKKYFGEAGSGR